MLPPGLAQADDAEVQQQPQLLRHRGLGHMGAVDQFVDRPFAVTEGIEELPPRRFREEMEDVGHEQSMAR